MNDISQTPENRPFFSSGKAQRKSLLPSREKRERLRRRRKFKDGASRYGIGIAGIGVVAALAMIFIYLFSEVAPMFRSASVEVEQRYPLPGLMPEDQLEHLMLDRYNQVGSVFTRAGEATFFEVADGSIRYQSSLPAPEGAETTSLSVGEAAYHTIAYGFDNGQATLARVDYEMTYPNDQRLVTPELAYPLGEAPVTLDEAGRPLIALGMQSSERGNYLVAATPDGDLLLSAFTTRENMMTGEVTVEQQRVELPNIDARPRQILIEPRLRHLYVSDEQGRIHHYDIDDLNNPRLMESVQVVEDGYVSYMAFMNGAVSLTVGTSNGQLSQWFPVRDDNNDYWLTHIRDFAEYPGSITHIAPEYMRKGFWAGDDQGYVGAHYGTSARDLFQERLIQGPVAKLAISPLNDMLIVVDAQGEAVVTDVWNGHPEISLRALWNKIWYEGRGEPEYVWQASSGSNEFEPKMSLVPLTIGTLKAAFYAMLFAIPLAVMGAIYTAYFMTPKLRGKVKPTIEIMEALPTVILGFLAGLWLAPFIEDRLPAVLGILILMPIGMLVFAFVWSRLPERVRTAIPDGWEAALLVPLILVIGWACVMLSPLVEIWFFDGSMRQWLTDVGIAYDQRNALVVGIAMGFAVIPTIFSIAEDAVFNVPKHLTQGSLALGATRWQTVVGVVIPTASPGLFSAVMMGFGRAVGETMIVLMATGNSPVLNFNIFEGMRTLSANIAVELPETAVGSSHFRVLFLAALVLLLMTFVVNTIAEIIRQRLRKRYSSL